MPREEVERLERENESLRTQLDALKEVLSQEIAAKASLHQSLHSASERYLDLTERAPWMVMRIDRDGRYVDVNSKALGTLGLAPQDLLDRTVGSCGESSSWAAELQSFSGSADELEREVAVEIQVDGKRFVLLVLMSRLQAQAGFSVLAIDQTERLELLEATRRASAAKSDFLSVMSHTIRTPLNCVVGLSTLLLETELEAQQRGFVRTICAAGEALSEVVDDAMLLAKEQDETRVIMLANFNPDQLVRAVVDSLREHDIESRFSIEQSPVGGLPKLVRGCPDRIQRGLVYCLRDLIERAPQGKLMIRTNYLPADDESASGQLSLEVESTIGGDGVDFDPKGRQAFFLEDKKVGLSLARGFISSVGGEITGGDHRGGTLLRIRLPVELCESEADVSSRLQRASGEDLCQEGVPLRVLLAEDNPVNRRVAEGLLKRAGCTVKSAVNGADAVDELMRECYDLVLMDVNMPVLDGLSATRKIRELERGGQIRHSHLIVALTANSIGGDREACLAAGMDEHILKPLRTPRLEEVLGGFGLLLHRE